MDQNITDLSLGTFSIRSSITDMGFDSLFEGMKGNNRIASLKLSQIHITDSAILHLSLLLTLRPSLRALDLYECKISDRGAQSIAEALKDNKALIKLYLGHNRITD